MNESALRRPGETVVSKTHMPFELDRGAAARARIGMIVLASDHTLEYEWRRIFANLDGVALYANRIYNSVTINAKTLAEMEARMTQAADLILPGTPLDVVAYGCTSGTVVIGEDKVFARIREARPGVACTTPITGAVAGLKAMGCKRIALLTPYVEEVNQMLRRHIEARGIGVPVMGSFNHDNDDEVARISTKSLTDAMLDLGSSPDVDGVFVSCTSLRVVEIAEAVEQRLGKPVTSSNHAMGWHALRLAGIKDQVPGFGRLFRL
jgi:maleate isomerase